MSDAAPTPRLSVIIINYNSREMTLECLETLVAQLPPGLTSETIVVDNGSGDGSVLAIRERFPAVILIENPANSGFGAANNLAMARARGEFFLLLNSDAFPRPGAIGAMLDAMSAHPQAGVVGPRLVYRDGRMQQSVFPFPSPATAWQENLWLLPLLPAKTDYSRWSHDADGRSVDHRGLHAGAARSLPPAWADLTNASLCTRRKPTGRSGSTTRAGRSFSPPPPRSCTWAARAARTNPCGSTATSSRAWTSTSPNTTGASASCRCAWR